MGNCFGKSSRRYEYDRQPFQNQGLSIVTISDDEPLDLDNAEYSSTHSSSYIEEDEETFVLEDSSYEEYDDRDDIFSDNSDFDENDNLQYNSSFSNHENENNNSLKWSSDSSGSTSQNYAPPHPRLGLLRSNGSEALSQTTIELRKDPGKANQPSYSPKILKNLKPIPPHIKNNFVREKSSSTSTLFINTTIEAPDNNEILKCMSVALHWNIKKHESMRKKKLLDVFSEELYPLSDNPDIVNIPSENTIYEFLDVIFSAEQLSAECGVMAMAYIDRLIAFTGISIVPSNWRRIVLGCLILASKVWEDQAVWNVDFVDVFSKVTVKDLNQLERHVLNGLQFHVSLKASVYAKYYFELRTLSERDDKHFPLKPLDKKGAKRLEKRSSGVEETAKMKKITRSKSADHWSGFSTPISLP